MAVVGHRRVLEMSVVSIRPGWAGREHAPHALRQHYSPTSTTTGAWSEAPLPLRASRST